MSTWTEAPKRESLPSQIVLAGDGSVQEWWQINSKGTANEKCSVGGGLELPYGRQTVYFVHPCFLTSVTTAGDMTGPSQKTGSKIGFSRPKKSGLVIGLHIPFLDWRLHAMHTQYNTTSRIAVYSTSSNRHHLS
jgi:hypothetical protein